MAAHSSPPGPMSAKDLANDRFRPKADIRGVDFESLTYKYGSCRKLEQSVDLIKYFQGARNIVTLEPGHVLFSEGEPGANMYVLMSGTASVSLGNDVLEIAKPGALLGEMALVDASTRSATVIAGTSCRVISVDRSQFNVLVRESPDFAVHVMTVMANRLRHMNERLKEALRELSVRGIRPT